MKKILTTVMLILALRLFASAQLFDDAVILNVSVNPETGKIPLNEMTIPILKKYFKVVNLTNIDNNPFLKGVFGSGASAANPALFNLPAASSLGIFDVGTIADGLSKFLIKRSKQELLMAFFSKLQDSTQFPEFKKVFPATSVVVNNFNSWEYDNIVSTMREAFNKDLQDILTDIPKLRQLDPNAKIGTVDLYKGVVKLRLTDLRTFLDSDDGRIFLSALVIGNGFVKGKKLPDMIDIIAGKDYLGGLTGASADELNTIKLIHILSNSMASSTPGQNYLKAADIDGLPIATKKIFLGLVFQLIDNDKIKIGTIDLAADIRINAAKINPYINFAKNLAEKGVVIDAAIQQLEAAKSNGETNLTKYWTAIMITTIRFFNYAENVFVIDPQIKLPTQVKKTLSISVAAIQIAADVDKKNYSGAIVLISKMIADNVDANKYAISGVQQFLIKYGSFAANIVQADSAAAVESAIEAIALPAGSFTLKQKSVFNISLNAYVGYGWDFTKLKLSSKNLYANGIYAPIGFSASMGGTKGNGAVTVFGSVIDVGSLVLYNLGADSVKKLKQTIRLESIISPSLQLFYEIPSWPLSVGAGWRRTPKLFFTNNSGFKVVDPKGVFNVSLLIDIPILTLYNRPRAQ